MATHETTQHTLLKHVEATIHTTTEFIIFLELFPKGMRSFSASGQNSALIPPAHFPSLLRFAVCSNASSVISPVQGMTSSAADPKPWQRFAAGSASGAALVLVGHPLDTLKVKLQVPFRTQLHIRVHLPHRAHLQPPHVSCRRWARRHLSPSSSSNWRVKRVCAGSTEASHRRCCSLGLSTRCSRLPSHPCSFRCIYSPGGL